MAQPSGSASSQSADPGTGTDLLLSRQIDLLAAGNGAASDCAEDLKSLPGHRSDSPAAWVSSSIDGSKSLGIPQHVALCLSGFPDGDVDITVSVQGHEYSTTAVPAEGEVTFQRMEPSSTLFQGGRLRLYDVGEGVQQSEMWSFVPPGTARERLALAGELTISARSGGVSATRDQLIELPPVPVCDWLDSDTRRLLVFGFEPGSRVPVGLYRTDREGTTAVLVRKIGTVVMPRSRTAVFSVPADIRALAGESNQFRITVPLDKQYNTPAL
ncbi:hypothetical protein [Streptomyces sp. Je 1-369]|uniref:hypothetical protein n=1 Tax=Streptomyces sp. Je 1-369 TaxID=2966192 RepID=UPI0022856352|nr:hypothetical protein [Streptomyces sp. Je 1-369]WAL93535.1 hypothetical protein NOO62_02955 [Streptomyces sp. Je 1-369]